MDILKPMKAPRTTRSAARPRQFSPVRNGPCLCGSGLKFKRCCADHLRSESLDYRERMLSFLREGKYKQALFESRAYVTQYTVWHKSHTVPAIRVGLPKQGSIFEIDIRALGDLVDDLMFCHVKTNMMEDFPAVLERLRSNIDDPDWQRKITYFHAFHALWPDWDRKAGRRELKKLGSIAEDKDENILQLYLDLFSNSLSFSEQLDLVERILRQSRSFSDLLHYRGAKAVLFLTIGDRRKADAELSEVIEEARARKTLGEYERHRLAQTLSLLGALRNDDTLPTEALELYKAVLSEGTWTPLGRADLLGLIGEVYRRKGKWEDAHQSYTQALDAKPIPIHKVFLSECLLQLEQLDQATKTLADVDPEQLTNAERVDYAFAVAALAIETGDRKRLENSIPMLKALEIGDPLFREQRDSVLLNVQEVLTVGISLPLIQRARRLFAGLARFVGTYFILKPTFMGMGVDVGKILEDLSKRTERSPPPPSDRRPGS